MASTFLKDAKELVRDLAFTGALVAAAGTVWYDPPAVLTTVSNRTVGLILISAAAVYLILMVIDYQLRVLEGRTSKRWAAVAALCAIGLAAAGLLVLHAVARHADVLHHITTSGPGK